MLKQILNYFQQNSDQYLDYLCQHLKLSIISLFIAMIVAVPLGCFIYKHKKISELVMTISQILRIIPSLAVLFILIPIIGVGELPAIIALIFLAIPSILVNTILGFYEISKITKTVAIGLGMNNYQLFWKIELPLAMPYILNGIKLALVEIIASATLATYIGAGGLGTLIFTGLGLYRMDLLLIGGISVSILSLVCMFLLDMLIRKVSKNYAGFSN